MAGWSKERGEKIDVPIDFSGALDSGDGLASVDTVEVLRHNGGGDKTSEFGTTGGSINGDQVEITFHESTATGNQRKGLYAIKCKVTTSNGDTLVAADEHDHFPRLTVTEDDPSFP